MAAATRAGNHQDRATKRRKLSTPEECKPQGISKKIKSDRSESKTKQKHQNGISKLDSQQPKSTPTTSSSEPQSPDLPPVKGLDSSEPHIRRKAFTTILSHLQSRNADNFLTDTQCLSLWRGFFVAAYMHDSKNMISVQNLLKDIAGTFETIARKDDETSEEGSEASMKWLESYHLAFHQTLVREWAGIDSHRMNKYLLLVRLVMRSLFSICLKPLSRQESESVGEQAEKQAITKAEAVVHILETDGPFNAKDRKIPDGLRLHVLDVWTTELFGALKDCGFDSEDDEGESSHAWGSVRNVLKVFRTPLEQIAKSDSGAQRHIRVRAKETGQAFDEQMEELP